MKLKKYTTMIIRMLYFTQKIINLVSNFSFVLIEFNPLFPTEKRLSIYMFVHGNFYTISYAISKLIEYF